ncbi:MAG: hypothetical protein LIQ30_09815 [Planctomycetes bacterium]|nr:hypothetical protein [Planctomycetota bacterium]MCD7897183.1 hypothetical protein [Planctomycetaceae bacterium]
MKRISLMMVFAVLAAASVATAADTVPNRLSYAKVGEWASYKLPSGYIQKLTVVDRSGDGPEAMVDVLVENIYDGEVIEAKRISHEAGEPMTSPETSATPGVLVAIRHDTAAVNGRTVPVTIVEVLKNAAEEDRSSTEWWASGDVPVFGIVKKVEDGETVWELDGFGDK